MSISNDSTNTKETADNGKERICQQIQKISREIESLKLELARKKQLFDIIMKRQNEALFLNFRSSDNLLPFSAKFEQIEQQRMESSSANYGILRQYENELNDHRIQKREIRAELEKQKLIKQNIALNAKIAKTEWHQRKQKNQRKGKEDEYAFVEKLRKLQNVQQTLSERISELENQLKKQQQPQKETELEYEKYLAETSRHNPFEFRRWHEPAREQRQSEDFIIWLLGRGLFLRSNARFVQKDVKQEKNAHGKCVSVVDHLEAIRERIVQLEKQQQEEEKGNTLIAFCNNNKMLAHSRRTFVPKSKNAEKNWAIKGNGRRICNFMTLQQPRK